jgi:hypothetical protein
MRTQKYKRLCSKTRTRLDHPVIKKLSAEVWQHNKIHKSGKYPKWRILHRGGGKITSNGYTFLYDETEDSIICVANKPYKGLCFKITFDEESGIVGIDISYNQGCLFNKQLPKSSGTLIMLQAILELVLTNKNIARYNAIVITDNSSISCRSHYDGKDYTIKLMDMYFVSTGCTWYSSLAPMFLLKQYDEKQYLIYKSRILSDLKWSDFLNKLPEHTKDVLTTEIEFDDPATMDLPAYVILNKIRKGQYHCIFFKLFLHDFMQAFDVESMYGKEWCIPLQNGHIISCEEDTVSVSCKHPEKGWLIPSNFIKKVSREQYTSIKQKVQIPDVPKEYVLQKNNPTKY